MHWRKIFFILCFLCCSSLLLSSQSNLSGQKQEIESSVNKTDVTESVDGAETVKSRMDEEDISAATIVGTEAGWLSLGEADFENVNCTDETWKWTEEGLDCNGDCVGVIRSIQEYENFELVVEWKHMQHAGNSGVFVWTPKASLDKLEANQLPEGIECQVLDHGYTEQYEKSGKEATWFTTNGDVFPVGGSKMKPFEPRSPNGVRSFPSANHSKGFGNWNHYYIRAINGEVRLWVNGHEVSGGNGCDPASGFVCLESEGAPIKFRNLKIRILP